MSHIEHPALIFRPLRKLVRLVNEEMDGVTREYRKDVEVISNETANTNKRPDT